MKRRFAKDATKSLTFKITSAHCEIAKCGDPNQCVVAQAMLDAFGDMLEGVEVGTTITKIYFPGQEIRYSTSSKLRRAIPIFDKTGQWMLPEGEYTLLPPSKSNKLGARPSRWKRVSKKKSKPGRDMFKSRAIPTRRVKKSSGIQVQV